MYLRKGMRLQFKNRTEIIIIGSRDPVMGEIKTDKQTYSCDFIHRWLQFGFVKILKQ